jgi:uncharacterized protein (TIGR03905 family)
MKYQYCTQGTCSRLIDFEIVDGIIKNVRFTGGCNGNLQGIASLVEGQRAEDVIPKLRGISCNGKPTSCPDQLARALKEALNS